MNQSATQSKVAIIGLGHIGKAIAGNLIKGGHLVILASRDLEASKALAKELGPLATAKETREAIREAELIIPCISFSALNDFFKTNSAELQGKIIVDVSNPIAPDGKGGFKKIIAENESATSVLHEGIPKSAKLVKAFGTLGAAALISDAFAQPERKVLFYASDNTNSNSKIEHLILSSGFDPLHVGGLDSAIRIEVFGDLHQFGALGKTVTLTEAKSKLINPSFAGQ
ncbi:MAG: NAD(P)-binding domain-containing protein [Bacteroidia bacterium]|nr:NAD(P)-binding domain-containing protein [Bacteroidia bacterium]